MTGSIGAPSGVPTLELVLTGTGTPYPVPGRAGAGALVRYGGVCLQFDAGRGTVMRLAEARTGPARLSAVFLTHHHSDHLVDLDDVLMTRWITRNDEPLPIVAPEGPTTRFAKTVLDGWREDLEARRDHGRRDAPPAVDVCAFAASSSPQTVWRRDDVAVSAVAVHHEPIEPAVAYRVDTPEGAVVISGDTQVCAEVEGLARGSQVLVHEACRKDALAGRPYEFVAEYHADTVELGAMAARADVPTLVLTHLIPPPVAFSDAQAFEDDVRRGGFTGEIVVGTDLRTVSVTRPRR